MTGSVASTRRTIPVLGYVAAFTIVTIAVAFLVPPIAQPLDYHAFADRRTLGGVPNFLDVASNVAFLVAGLGGLAVSLVARTKFASNVERWPYAVFFAGLVLTAGGSAWYHLQPDNERLFWDRLPMTLAFTSLVSAQIADRIDARIGAAALVPLVIAGAATVVYWRATERAGEGNLVPYALLQVWSLGALVILALQRSRYTHGGAIFGVLACYFVAKLCELFDRAILDVIHVASGHTLKHVVAAVAGLIVARMLYVRELVATNVRPAASRTDARPFATSRPR